MSDVAPSPQDRFDRFLTAMVKLPAAAGVTFRGLPAPAPTPEGLVVTAGVNATSRDPRVASEGGSHTRLLAVAGRSGRDLSALSAHPDEAEVVLLPGAALLPLGRMDVPEVGVTVYLVEELASTQDGRPPGAPVGVPPTREELTRHVRDAVLRVWRGQQVQVHVPGKFAGSLL